MSDILRFDSQRRRNSQMVSDIAKLGLINKNMFTLDATWGLGAWWRDWEPEYLVGLDLDGGKARDVCGDFRRLPFRDGVFDLVCFDPPYGYRGRSEHRMDEQYGLREYLSPEERDKLLSEGIEEVVRIVRRGGVVVVKCQDQVVSGWPRMQSHLVAAEASNVGLRLLSVLEVAGGVRSQRSQRTVRNNTSQGLVFKKVIK